MPSRKKSGNQEDAKIETQVGKEKGKEGLLSVAFEREKLTYRARTRRRKIVDSTKSIKRTGKQKGKTSALNCGGRGTKKGLRTERGRYQI